MDKTIKTEFTVIPVSEKFKSDPVDAYKDDEKG
jgi:hypothetical protein